MAKDKWLKIRVSPEEQAAFTEQAKQESLSLSSWIRHHLMMLVRSHAEKKSGERQSRIGRSSKLTDRGK